MGDRIKEEREVEVAVPPAIELIILVVATGIFDQPREVISGAMVLQEKAGAAEKRAVREFSVTVQERRVRIRAEGAHAAKPYPTEAPPIRIGLALGQFGQRIG